MSEQDYRENEKLQNVLHKELDLIQAVITRMAQNSFYMKGWCVTLIAAIYSLSDASSREHVYLPLAFMTMAFWWLDSYYLRQERAYRKLYGCVLKRRVERDCWLNLYSLDARRMLRLVPCVPRIMFSISEWPLYLVLCVTFLVFGRSDVCHVWAEGAATVKGVICTVSKNGTKKGESSLGFDCSTVLPSHPTKSDAVNNSKVGAPLRERPEIKRKDDGEVL